MFPLSRMLSYGNTTAAKPKLKYNFDLGVNEGTWVPTIASGTYFTLPTNPYGYTKGIMGGQLSFTSNYTVGVKDYFMECTFYVGSNVSGYSTLFAFGSTGMRFGDSGFANRLQFASTFGSAGTIYSLNATKASLYQGFNTLRMERVSNVLKVYLNGVQSNFAIGTSSSYTNSEIADNYSIPQDNVMYCGVSNFPVVKVQFDFK